MNNKIVKNTIYIFSLIIIGKGLSFLRDIIISNKFGSTFETDAYFIANNVPSILYTAIISSFLILVIPYYKDIFIKKGKKEADIFSSRLINVFIIISIILTFLGLLFSNHIINIIAPGFDKTTSKLSVELCKILLLSFPFSSITLILANISNANEKYYAPHLIPILSSIFVIIPLLAFSNRFGITTLAFAGVTTYIFQLIIQIYICKKDFIYYPKSYPIDENIKKMIILMLPIFLGYSIDQVNILITSSMCTYLPTGNLSSFNYAIRLQSVINGSISIAVISVIYPLISELYTNNNIKRFNLILNRSIRVIISILIPIIILLSLFSKEIVSIVYFRGNFDKLSLEQTSLVFRFTIIAVIFTSIRDIVLRAFYISKDTKSPLYASFISLLFNIILSYLLVHKFQLLGIVLANLSSTIISFVAIILYINIKKMHFNIFFNKKFYLKTIFTIILFTSIINTFKYFINTSNIFLITSLFMLSIMLYLAIIVLLKQKEGLMIIKYLKQRFNDIL